MSRKPVLAAPLVAAAAAVLMLVMSAGSATAGAGAGGNGGGGSRTPIKHVVVIFQENVSFDHYFGTYPNAANTDGQTFNAAGNTPSVNGLTQDLLTNNPNESQPERLDSSPIGLPGSPGGQLTCDQDHNYTDEQTAFDAGLMDKFVQSVGTGPGTNSPFGTPCNANQVMDYYDGNTVTGLWNYAQHFAMSDNSYGTTFGPSSPGAINLAAGNTTVDSSNNGALLINGALNGAGTPNADLTPNGQGGYSLTSDAQPYYDDCSTRDAVAMAGPNIGDELNKAGLSWGWFEGGFRPSTSYADALADVGASGQPTSTFTPDQFKSFFANTANRPAHSSNETLCSSVHPIGVALGGTGQWGYKDDYIPHHDPFQYYGSTANPHHLTLPTDASGNDTLAGLATIGRDTQSYVNGAPQFNTPNHQYDTSDFDQLVSAITAGQLPPSALPAVSFLKAPGYQDGHGAYSDPADEQAFITGVINALEASPDWHSTAVIINYDDSDGWYDHAFSGVTNPSASGADSLTGAGLCGTESPAFQPLGGEQGRCGLGPRLPFLVISPYAKHNYVDHNVSDQSSILNFIEYNWRLPGIPGSADQLLAMHDRWQGIPFDIAGMFNFCARNPKLVLDPVTGQPVAGGGDRRSGQDDQGCDRDNGDHGGDSQGR
jgi:phospholipase C